MFLGFIFTFASFQTFSNFYLLQTEINNGHVDHYKVVKQ